MTHELKPRILVFGVGGAGGNAVDNMIEANLQGVEFIVANTDAQALSRSKTENRIQLGPETTSGLGAGARPDIGAKAAGIRRCVKFAACPAKASAPVCSRALATTWAGTHASCGCWPCCCSSS